VNALRGLALIFIFLYHGGGVLNRPNELHGEVGVDVFLLLSGFLLSLHASEISGRDFLRKRFGRIFPSYWLALAFFVILGTALLHRVFTVSDVLLHLAGLHATFRGAYFSDINDSFWFISTIIFLYLVFFLLRRWVRDPPLVLGVGGLITLVSLLPYPGFVHLAGRLPGFFIGVAVGQFYRGGDLRLRPGVIFAAGAAVLTILTWQARVSLQYPLAAVGVAATFLVLDRGLRLWPAGRLLLAPLGFLGTYSYELYLLHQPLIRDYNFWFQRNLLQREPSSSQLVWGMLVALALAVGLAMLVAALARRRRRQSGVLVGAGLALAALALGAGPVLTGTCDRMVAGLQGPILALIEPGSRWQTAAPPDPALDGWSGPLRLVVKLPATTGGMAEPLVVTGRTGRADLLGLIRVDAGHVRFTLDHWGQYALASPDLQLTAAPEHTIDVFLGSLLPATGSPWRAAHPESAPLARRLRVTLDGQVAFDREMEFHPAAAAEAFVGINPLGGSTTAARFTGRSLIVQSLGLPSRAGAAAAGVRP
jgi:peptidoglycan/LPS O-acetylase OafA/YrhL